MRIISALSLFVVLSAPLVGCGSSSATNAEAAPAAPVPTAVPPSDAAAAKPNAAPAAPAAAPAEADTGFKLVSRLEVKPDGRYLVAEVTPEPGFHINLEFPWALSIAPTAPVLSGKRFPKSEAKELVAERARYEIAVPAEGSGTVDASLRLSVCNDRECRTPTAPVSWKL